MKTTLCGALVALLLLGGVAQAGPTTQVVIDEAPEVVDFGDSVPIIGHAENAFTGQTVHLERRIGLTKEWIPVAEQALPKSKQVSFVVESVRRSAFYRLRLKDVLSEEVRVGVRARLTLETSPRDLMEGDSTIVSGFLRPVEDGRNVLLERRIQGEWNPIGRALVEDGRYALPTRFTKSGFRSIRATFDGDEVNEKKRARAVARVHRPSLATWYGPGFFGNYTACGQLYTRKSVGVAHRTLPCGTKVHVLFNGAMRWLEVIDRGPFGESNWDLSRKAARSIGFYGKEDIGVLIRR